MKFITQQALQSVTRALLGVIHRAPYLTLLAALALTALAAGAARELQLKTKIQDLLPADAPSLQASEALSERLGSVDILVVTLMSSQLERVRGALPELARRLEAHPDVDHVNWRQDTTLIQQNALITFSSLDELRGAYEELTAQIKRAVKRRMSLLGAEEEGGAEGGAEAEGRGAEAEGRGEERERRGETLAWGEREGEEPLSALGRSFRASASDYPEHFYNNAYTTIGLKVFPRRSSSDIKFCAQIVGDVERLTREVVEELLGPISPQGVVSRVDIGGSYRYLLQESEKIKSDILSSTLYCFALLALVLIVSFRSLRAFFCIMLPLVMGTAWTMGLMALTLGYMNLITAFIFAVLLGLGIDFGIHFYARYREERAAGAGDLEAMVTTYTHSGAASLLALSTTVASFLALTLADFKGLSQFGGVAAMGVTLCLLAVMAVLPAVAFAWERAAPLRLLGYRVDVDVKDGLKRARPFPLGGRAALVACAAGVAGLALTPRVELELNFNNLGERPAPAAARAEGDVDYKELQYGTTKATSPTVILARSAAEAADLVEQLEALRQQEGSHISSVQALSSLVPTQQAEKISAVRRLCDKLRRKVKLFEGDQRAGAEELLTRCAPHPFSVADLPPWVKENFTERSGELGQFIYISPKGSTSNGEVALAFHAEMQRLKTHSGEPAMVAGKTMVWAEVLQAIEEDALMSFGAALAMVLLLVWLFERNARGLLFVSAPLLLGLGLTIGWMALTGQRLNFFNMLALPTLIGMGVDDGVHMHHRYKELGPGSARYIVRTTGFSALLTTLTTAIGFASLMLTSHLGLRSLGLLTVVGMSAALFATLVILPALFTWWDQRQAAR